MGKKRKKTKKKKGVVPPPKCKAILLCDQTIIEEGTGKVTIIGIFNECRSAEFPGVIRPFTIFAQLTDGLGRYDLSAEVHDLNQDRVIARSPTVAIEWRERLVAVNVLIPVPPLAVNHAGAYDLVLLASGQEIDRQKFTVVGPGKTGN